MKPLKITETVLRDGHQSQIATRMRIDEMLPVLKVMDQVGYHAMEVWGGATFDVCLRYLDENPWERLRIIRSEVKNTKLQMLLRGQNLLGYKHYPNDVVEKFIQKSIYNGIDIIRVFDALNDLRNLEQSIITIKKEKGHCQCAIAYTTSKVHNIEYFVDKAKDMEDLGADSICIKDMAGILLPKDSFDLVKALKENLTVPVELHGHCTSGIAEMAYQRAVDAGVDIIDTALSPFAAGTSQPSTESIVQAYKGTSRPTTLDEDRLNEVARHMAVVKDNHAKQGDFNPKVMKIEPKILQYQVPGGMLSNLLSQMQAQHAEDRYEEVLKEISRVREDLGFPPLVTPLSQMVGTQAVFNVLSGERYKMVPNEIKEYVRGFYGKSPAPVDEEIKKLIIGDEETIDYHWEELLRPSIELYRQEREDLAKDDEMLLAHILFPEMTDQYLKSKEGEEIPMIEIFI